MRLPLAALAALTLSLSASCGGSDGGPGGDTTGAAAAPPLTKAEAQKVLDTYETTYNQANKTLDGKLLKSTETGVQLDMDLAGYKLRRATKQKFTALTYTQPVFFIPRLRGYPHWFAVAAGGRDRAGSDQRAGGQRAEGQRAEGQRADQRQWHALLFLRDRAGAPWRLAAAPRTTGKSLDGVATDKEGYATAVAADDPQLALTPAKVGAAHATLLTGGPKTPGASGIGVGPHTTRAYDALKAATGQFAKVGITLTSRFTPGSAPVFALRTTDGGAMVWYVLQQRERYTARKAGVISVTGDLIGLASPDDVKNRLDATVFVQYLSKIPPKDKGTAEVTGTYRKAVQAVAT